MTKAQQTLYFYIDCLSYAIMVSIVMLNVIVLIVVAPKKTGQIFFSPGVNVIKLFSP
jgi:hypothetical protein